MRGTASAGSVFAKLNKLIAEFLNHVASWTAARAAKIDTIDSNTAINNTASKTGNLSQKMSDIILSEEEAAKNLTEISGAVSEANFIHIEGSNKKGYFEVGTDGILCVKEA